MYGIGAFHALHGLFSARIRKENMCRVIRRAKSYNM